MCSSLQITDLAERAGGLAGVSATTLSYVGKFTITDVDSDEIHAIDTGIFNTATGAFATVTEIDDGTGKYVDSTCMVDAPFTGELCLTDD